MPFADAKVRVSIADRVSDLCPQMENASIESAKLNWNWDTLQSSRSTNAKAS